MDKYSSEIRKNYWHNIITYVPSSIRYERINVGVMMGAEDYSWVKLAYLNDNNDKIKNFLMQKEYIKDYDKTMYYFKKAISLAFKAEYGTRHHNHKLTRVDEAILKYFSLDKIAGSKNVDWDKWLCVNHFNGMPIPDIYNPFIIINDTHYARTTDDSRNFIFKHLLEEYIGLEWFEFPKTYTSLSLINGEERQ
ncbi:MAG: hypothetical protein [Caudoviricetes sp.]|nr:MAG: hypothetical protein [Caudoviricetes sp.]